MRPRFHRRRYASSVYTSVAGVSPFTRNIQLERIPSCIFFLGKLYATPRTRTSPPHFRADYRVVVSRQKFPALRSFEPDRDLTRSETRRCSRRSAARTPSIVEQKNERDDTEQNVNLTRFSFQIVRAIYRTMKLRRSITVRNKCDLRRRTTTLCCSSGATSDTDNPARSFIYRAANRNSPSR